MSSGETIHGSGLRILKLPEASSRLLTVWFPAPDVEASGLEAVAAGQEFALDLDGTWHRVMITSATAVSAGGVELRMRIGERLP